MDATGHLANWMIPGKLVPGMGGAMDLASGAKSIIVAMQHVSRGVSKIVERCNLPLTSGRAVDMIVTDLAVFKVVDGSLLLTELSEGVDLSAVSAVTDASFAVCESLAS